MTDELKPCPFCGSNRVYHNGIYNNSRPMAWCDMCGATTRLEYWNDRNGAGGELLDAARRYNTVRADYDATWSAWSENTDKAAYEEWQTLSPVMERARVALDEAVKAVGV